jgi:hypothetical protein
LRRQNSSAAVVALIIAATLALVVDIIFAPWLALRDWFVPLLGDAMGSVGSPTASFVAGCRAGHAGADPPLREVCDRCAGIRRNRCRIRRREPYHLP